MRRVQIPAFRTVSKGAVAEDIVAQLLSMIREKKLRPGDKLPPERDLAVMMNVSRPSLREALRTLSVMGVIVLRHGSGIYVTALEPAKLVAHLDFVFSLDDSTYLQLFETRKMLEPPICALAAQRITEEEMAQLEECLTRSRMGLTDYEAYLQADLDLHEIIATAARNPLLQRFMSSLRSLGKASRQRTATLPGIVEQTIQDHQSIIQALRDQQPEAARLAMLVHLEHVEQRLKQEPIAT
jgi:GntR family transcriptional regulator, transcriptional repressor for pyruvate dehydrogenase complex